LELGVPLQLNVLLIITESLPVSTVVVVQFLLLLQVLPSRRLEVQDTVLMDLFLILAVVLLVNVPQVKLV